MQFCDDCGSMMVAEGDRMVCTDCDASQPRDAEAEAAFVSTEEQTHGDLIEADDDAEYEGKPTASDVTCEACGHGEAWYEIRQTASADEPPTRFLRCKECDNTWREYN
jgi:DNA-directed RNA polymerase subunit M